MHKLLRLNKIEHSYTIIADAINLWVSFIVFVIIAGPIASKLFADRSGVPIVAGMILFGLVFAYCIARVMALKSYFKVRFTQMQAYAAAYGGKAYATLVEYSTVTSDAGSLQTTLGHISESCTYINFLAMPQWTYFDFWFDKYRQGRYGDYKSASVYYGVMKTKLPRSLPNIFFDSKDARKRQFRFVFKKRQIYKFEGDFDKFFTTYIPANYTIDSLSFITPDVMQALKDARAYDAEIVDDELFLYGPIEDLNPQLADMSQKIMAVSRALWMSAAAYKDDHLPADAGWHQVGSEGSALARSKFWAYVSLAVVAAYFIFQIGLSVAGNK